MKTKLIPATEGESSWTGRISSVDIGILLAKVHSSDFEKVAEAFMQAGNMAHEDMEKIATSFFVECIKCSSERRQEKPESSAVSPRLKVEDWRERVSDESW